MGTSITELRLAGVWNRMQAEADPTIVTPGFVGQFLTKHEFKYYAYLVRDAGGPTTLRKWTIDTTQGDRLINLTMKPGGKDKVILQLSPLKSEVITAIMKLVKSTEGIHYSIVGGDENVNM